MKHLYILSFLLAPFFASAQFIFTGAVADETGKPLPFATVALLYPADSTLAFFGITNEKGRFEIRQVKNGNYLMQVSFMGFTTWYHNLSIRTQPHDFGIIVLKQKALDLPATSIEGERIPLSIKQDTVEYNAGAFKTKPDAVVEDLLKKLPGIEVDRAGNIKALGEDVKNVMVDGKEFFSSDPKVATKNLPADAINKVQVYDKKSEESELAGIDDGSHEKTINLLLKDGRKQAWLGELSAGGGTGDHYDLSAKAYRFTSKNQFAMLGMINNINKFGFTFRDYLDFNGGLQSMHGGGMKLTLNSDDDIPVNFGQTIEGLVTSGAGGLNYSYEQTIRSTLSSATAPLNLKPGTTCLPTGCCSTNSLKLHFLLASVGTIPSTGLVIHAQSGVTLFKSTDSLIPAKNRVPELILNSPHHCALPVLTCMWNYQAITAWERELSTTLHRPLKTSGGISALVSPTAKLTTGTLRPAVK